MTADTVIRKELNLTELVDLKPDVDTIADSLAIQWPGIMAEDIASEMWIVLTDRWGKITAEAEGDVKRIALGLAKRAGIAFCSRERQYFQHMTAEWIYTPREVRALLAEFYLVSGWEDTPKKPEGSNQTISGDGVSVALMDIRTGYESLAEQDQTIIMRAFRQEERLFSTDEKRLQRAVDRLTANLNRRMAFREVERANHDGPGSRRIVSNATARAVTGNHY